MKKIAIFATVLMVGFAAHAQSRQATLPKHVPLKSEARKADPSQIGSVNGCKNSAFGQTRSESYGNGRACGNVSKS